MSNDQSSTALAILIARVIALLPMLGGVVMLYFGVKEIRLAKESVSWPSTDGTIQSSAARWNENSETGRNNYRAEVQYRYKVDGLILWGDEIAFGVLGSSYTSAVDIANRYPTGTTVRVYFCGERSDVCILEPGLQHGQFWFLPSFGLFLFLVGVGLAIIFSPKAIRRREEQISRGADASREVVACSNPPPMIRIRSDGQVLELTPRKNRPNLASFAAVLCTPILFMYVGFAIKEAPIVFGFIGIVLLPVCLALCALSVFTSASSETITLLKDRIEIRRSSRWSGVAKEEVRTSDITEVTVTTHDCNWSVAIAILDVATQEKRSVSFGSHSALSFEAAEWIRNCLLQVVASVATQRRTTR